VPSHVSPTDLLAQALRHDAGRPFVTFYDLELGGRVELSVATFENWTVKTANLLAEECDVGAGDVVSIVLPAHWLGLVAVQAVWTLGGRVALHPAEGAAAHLVADGEPPAAPEPAPSLVVVGTRPLGGPARSVPAGATDLGRDALTYPDVLVGPTAPSDDPLLSADGDALAGPAASRTLVTGTRVDQRVVRQALVQPLVRDGSVVLVRPGGSDADPRRLDSIAATERALPLVG